VAKADRWRTPILLVPSLINRWYVLDLGSRGAASSSGWSPQGHDVFIIDWGTPGDEDRYLTSTTSAGRYLGRAVRKTASLRLRRRRATCSATAWAAPSPRSTPPPRSPTGSRRWSRWPRRSISPTAASWRCGRAARVSTSTR
jgi:hypothetical protein